MIAIEHTRDREAIHQLAKDPAIFRHISDDFVIDAKDWTAPAASPAINYLLAVDDLGPCGFGVFMARNWTCWESHVAFLPRAYGASALTAFREMIAWMWANTSARRLVGDVCAENRVAIAFAKRAGFREYGYNARALMRGGKLIDQVCLGISRG